MGAARIRSSLSGKKLGRDEDTFADSMLFPSDPALTSPADGQPLARAALLLPARPELHAGKAHAAKHFILAKRRAGEIRALGVSGSHDPPDQRSRLLLEQLPKPLVHRARPRCDRTGAADDDIKGSAAPEAHVQHSGDGGDEVIGAGTLGGEAIELAGSGRGRKPSLTEASALIQPFAIPLFDLPQFILAHAARRGHALAQ